MASVSIEFTAFTDPRYRILADISNQSRFDAMGRMAAIWAYCIDKNRSVLSEPFIDALAETKGFSGWMIKADLAERIEGDGIRIKGTEGRIEYLAKARERQKKATEAATQKRSEATTPILEPTLDPKLEPPLVSSSTSTSASSEKQNTYMLAFDSVLAEYKQLPGVQKGAKAEKRFQDQVKSKGSLDQLYAAIRNYRTFLSWPENEWRKPKTTFETFLGSKANGFFWHDFVELPARGSSPAAPRAEMEF